MEGQSGTTGFGALRFTGLMQNRQATGSAPQAEEQSPFYRPEWMNGPDFAGMAAYGDVIAGPGEAIQFDSSVGCGQQDGAMLTTPGIYYAAYTLYMPAQQPMSAEIGLFTDGQLLQSSLLRIDHDGSAQAHASGCAVFGIQGATHLQLMAGGHLDLRGAGQEPIATLTAFRIG